MPDPQVAQPYRLPPTAYKVPLDSAQAALVGYFGTVWGQLDFFMGMCIAHMLKVDIGACGTLMENMTTGPRLNLFYRLAREKIQDASVLKQAKTFNLAMGALIEKRNHIVHGMWGYCVDQADPTKTQPAVHYSKNSKNPLLMAEFQSLVESAAEQTFVIVSVYQHLSNFTWARDDQNPPTFLMGHGPPPGWLGGSAPRSS